MGQRLGNNCISDTNGYALHPANPIDMRVLMVFIQKKDFGISINYINTNERGGRTAKAARQAGSPILKSE